MGVIPVRRTRDRHSPAAGRRPLTRAVVALAALATVTALTGCASASSSATLSASPTISWSGESIRDGVPMPSGVAVVSAPASISGARYPRDWSAEYRLTATTTAQVIAELDALLPGTGWTVQTGTDHLMAVRNQPAQTDMLRAEILCAGSTSAVVDGNGCLLRLGYTSRNVSSAA